MRIEVRGHHRLVSAALRAHIERRMRFALGRFTPRVQRMTVRVSDANGPRGGVDKTCRVAVVLPPFKEVVIEDVDTEMYAAIDRAANRASRVVQRHLARSRDAQRTVVADDGALR